MDDQQKFPLLSPEDPDDINWEDFLAEIKNTDLADRESAAVHSAPAEKKPRFSDLPGIFVKNKRLITGIAAGILLVILGCLLIPELTDPYDHRILPGVSVGGLDVGGMTRKEAGDALREAAAQTLESRSLILQFPRKQLQLKPEEMGISLRVSAAVRGAYRVGRSGSREEKQADLDASQAGRLRQIGLTPYLSLKENVIRSTLEAYALEFDTQLAEGSWCIAGSTPELSTALSPDEIDCQTLQITLGTPTSRLDQEDAFRKILALYDNAFSACGEGAYTLRDFRVDILEEAGETDLQAIYDSLCLEAVDDSLDMTTYQQISGSYGYGFDLKAVEKQLASADWGETVTVAMEVTAPEIMGEDVYFRDILGQCETPHTKDENRNHNLTLACKAMDGLILQPGDVFSYNDTLGQRTKERGYKKAGAYSGWELVSSYGGGICQGSSTIYCAALYADLEIVFRKNHGYKVGYIDAGLDATVNWGGPDFQFRNDTNFPIRIDAEVSDGYVKVKILGTEERDYYIKMESESSQDQYAIYAKSYKCKYDRETDALISRELEARSQYNL